MKRIIALLFPIFCGLATSSCALEPPERLTRRELQATYRPPKVGESKPAQGECDGRLASCMDATGSSSFRYDQWAAILSTIEEAETGTFAAELGLIAAKLSETSFSDLEATLQSILANTASDDVILELNEATIEEEITEDSYTLDGFIRFMAHKLEVIGSIIHIDVSPITDVIQDVAFIVGYVSKVFCGHT